MDVQGWVVVGLALILFGYLVPHLVHSRHQLAQSRVEDRFSTNLRVVTTGATEQRSAGGDHHQRENRPYLHDPRRRTEAPAVNRPTTASERAAGEARRIAQLRAARAAEISRRKAAAKRRLVLTVVLLLASVGGWLGVGLASFAVVLGIVPTVLLAGVVVLGRRAAKIAARRNAADRAAMARLEPRPAARTRPEPAAGTANHDRTRSAEPSVTGRGAETTADTSAAADETAPPATATTAASTPADEAPAAGTAAADQTPEESSEPAEQTSTDGSAPAARATAAETVAATEQAPSSGTRPDAGSTQPAVGEDAGAPGQGWTPVPVPVPAYTLKAAAPRRDIAPYEQPAPEPAPVAERSEPVVVSSGLAGSPYAPVADPEPAETERPEAPPARGIDLDSVLARRRGA